MVKRPSERLNDRSNVFVVVAAVIVVVVVVDFINDGGGVSYFCSHSSNVCLCVSMYFLKFVVVVVVGLG